MILSLQLLSLIVILITTNSNRLLIKQYKEANSFFLFSTFLSIDSNGIVSHASTISSHVITKFSAKLFMQVQFSKHSSISQSLSHPQARVLGFQTECSFHTPSFIRCFDTHIDTYRYSIFYHISYHQV